MTPPRPPVIARALLLLSVPAGERETIPGDLEEEFGELAVRDTPGARRWYWRQVLQSLAPLARLRLRHLVSWRLAGAVALGYSASFVTGVVPSVALGHLAVPTSPVVFVMINGAAFVLGGYVTATVAGRRELESALFLVATTLAIAFALMSGSPEREPLVYQLPWIALVAASAAAGGHLRARHRRAS